MMDDERHSGLVIRTVLSRGTWDQMRWLFRRYGRERVRAVFLDDYFGQRTIPESTRALWELAFVDAASREDPRGARRWRGRRLAPRDPSPEGSPHDHG